MRTTHRRVLGSSPLTRGAPTPAEIDYEAVGLIPADAGSTL